MNYSLTHNLCRLVHEGQMHYLELGSVRSVQFDLGTCRLIKNLIHDKIGLISFSFNSESVVHSLTIVNNLVPFPLISYVVGMEPNLV